jgi:DnaJ-class molecular chaperone
MDNGMNHPNYSRAEREHNEPKDSSDDDCQQCPECGGTGERNIEGFGWGYEEGLKDDECSECDGKGVIHTPKLTREEYAEIYEEDDEEE